MAFMPALARSRRRAYGWTAIAAAVVLVAMTYFPTVFVLSNSLKSGATLANGDVFSLFSQFDLNNYVQAWHGVSTSLLNTVIVAAAAIVIGVAAAVLGAYAFAQVEFRGKEVLFVAYLGLMMIPFTLTMIPLFLMLKGFGLYNSWWALILPYAASSQPLLVLLFRGFFEQLPKGLLESARLDGCREWQVLTKIVGPLTRPIVMTGAILMTINIWGDYIWPEIMIQQAHRYTVSAGLQEFVGSLGLSGAGGGAVFAAYIISMIPPIALVCLTMRYFVAGMTEGALKL